MTRLERIVAQCGGILLDGGKRALIPGLGHSHKDRSVSLAETEEGRILIHCFSAQDDWRAVRRALAEKGLLDEDTDGPARPSRRSTPKIATPPVAEERFVRAQRIWRESRAIHCTAASAYLRRRAIADSVCAGAALRFHPRMTGLDDRLRRPALIAAITGRDGVPQGVQVTLLTAHGTAKAPVPTPRRVIGKLMGGAVRLHEATDLLAVGEGVETMLSASEALGAPAWAALSADNLAGFAPPACVRRLIIVVDNDSAGRAAAERLRAAAQAIAAVETAPAPAGFNDWNDWARHTKGARSTSSISAQEVTDRA